jgi:hypothetical protein
MEYQTGISQQKELLSNGLLSKDYLNKKNYWAIDYWEKITEKIED